MHRLSSLSRSDGIVEQIFDDVMLVTLAMHKNDNARCEGGNIFHKIKVDLFSKLSKSKVRNIFL